MKLKYNIALIILTSVATSQNIDATSYWQRAKDIAKYRWFSLLSGLGLGGYAYTAQDPKYKILTGLCAAGLLRYACTTAPDTSTLEGLLTFAANNIDYPNHKKDNSTDTYLIRTKLIKMMKNNSSQENQLLQNQIMALDNLLQKLQQDTADELVKNPTYTMVNGKLNEEGEKKLIEKYFNTLGSFIDNPSSVNNNANFQNMLKAVEAKNPRGLQNRLTAEPG